MVKTPESEKKQMIADSGYESWACQRRKYFTKALAQLSATVARARECGQASVEVAELEPGEATISWPVCLLQILMLGTYRRSDRGGRELLRSNAAKEFFDRLSNLGYRAEVQSWPYLVSGVAPARGFRIAVSVY